MSSVIEPIQLLGATTTKIDKENSTTVANAELNAQIDKLAEEIRAAGSVGIDIDGHTLAASSDSEQVVATIAPPIQSHVVAQIPAVDYNVDAPTAPKIINHQVLSSKIVNPA